MNDTLKFIQSRYQITSFDQEMPIKVNADRFKELPKLFRKLGFKVGAEIGVSTGKYSKFLQVYIPNLKLYCIDPWLAYGDYIEAHDADSQILLNSIFETAKTRLAPYNCEFIKKCSMDAVKDFEDNSLDFVYIDGNHSFQYAIDDIAQWSKKVKIGGIISGHDYWNSGDNDRRLYLKNLSPNEKVSLCQVKDAVLAWTKTNKISPWFVTALDNCSSWFWVKE